MNLFREMDLYKAIILVSLVLIPASLGFVYWVEGQLETADAAIRAAERSNGEIEKIGMLQRQLETVEKNASTARSTGGSHRVYFEQQIQISSGGSLSANDFEISPETRLPVSGRKNAQDQQVSIQFRREGKDIDLPRDFVHAVVFNCESSGAQIWKLRELRMRNSQLAKLGRSKKAPPKTVDDLWQVQSLVFSRREPNTSGRR